MADTSAELKITANTTAAENAITGFASKANKSLESIENAFSTLKTVAVAAIGVFVGHEVVNAIGEMINEASAAEVSFNKLQVAMKLSGDFSQKASDEFIAFAENIQKTTTFSNDAVVAQLAMAKSFGVSNEGAKKLVTAATELSAVTGQDLESSVRTLNTTLTGSAGPLKKLLPGFKDLTDAQLRSGEAIDIINAKFSGSAAAAANTFAGALKQVSNAFSDFQKESGFIITRNPVIIKLIQLAKDAFIFLEEAVKENAVSISQFISQGINALIQTLPTLIGVVQNVLLPIIKGLVTLFQLAALGAIAFVQGLLQVGPIAEVFTFMGKAISLAVAGFLTLVQTFAKLPGVSGVLDAIGLDTAGLDKKITTLNDGIFKFADGFSAEKVQAGLDGVATSVTNTFKTTDNAFGKVDESLNVVKDKTVEVAKSFEDASKRQVKAANAASAAIQNQTDANQALLKAQAERIKKNREEAIGAASKAPLDVLSGKIKADKEGVSGSDLAIGAGAGAINTALKGAQGAVTLVSGAAGAIASAFGPFGGIVQELVANLALGPDKVKEMINSFTTAIPGIIQNIVLAVPALVDALVLGVDDAVNQIIANLPQLANQLVDEIIRVIQDPKFVAALLVGSQKFSIALSLQAPFIAISFSTALIKEAPAIALAIAQGAAQAIKDLLANVGGGVGKVGGAVGNVVSSVGKFLGFADGGTPRFTGGDNILAGFRADELVIDKGTTVELQKFLSNQKTPTGQSASSQNQNEQPQALTLINQIGETEISRVLLNINRKGFRTS